MVQNFNTAQLFKEPEMRRTIAVNYIRGDNLFDSANPEDQCRCGSEKDPRNFGEEEGFCRPNIIPGSNPPLCQACCKPAITDDKQQITTLLMLVNRGTESLGPHLGACDFCILAVPISVEARTDSYPEEVKAKDGKFVDQAILSKLEEEK